MFDQLMDLVRESGQKTVVENQEVPNDLNDAVMEEASSSIFNGLQQMLQTGGPGALKTLFEGVQSGDDNNPAVQQVANRFSGNIAEKFGLSTGVAKTIAMSLIPVVLNKLMGRAQSSNTGSGIDIGGILGSLMGGSAPAAATNQPQQPQAGGGMLDNLSKMGAQFGLDRDKDGDTDLSDLIGMFNK